MTGRRRPLKTPEQRQAQWSRSIIPGTVGGRIQNASPVSGGLSMTQAGRRGSGGTFGTNAILFKRDRYTLGADGAQTVALTYLPRPDSEHVYLNGIEQDEDTDWSRSERNVSVLAPMAAKTGDVLEVRYAYLSGLPSSLAGGSVILGPLRFLQQASSSPSYSDPAFDDSAWAIGQSAWASDVSVSGDDPVRSVWDLNTYLWVRTTVTGAGTIGGRVDNDLIVYVNGVSVLDVVSENFNGVWSVPVGNGDAVALRARDRGITSYLSIRENQ